MYVADELVFNMIDDRLKHIKNCVDELYNLMPDDLTYKQLRLLAKEIIEMGKELKAL